DSEVLLHRTQATVLDRGALLDDEGDRGGSTLGRLLEGVSHERARCLTRHSAVRDIPDYRSPPGQVCNDPFSRLDRRLTPPRSGRAGSYNLLNNLSPGNRALRYRGVIALIRIAPIPNRGFGCPGIRGVVIAIVIAAIIGSRC